MYEDTWRPQRRRWWRRWWWWCWGGAVGGSRRAAGGGARLVGYGRRRGHVLIAHPSDAARPVGDGECVVVVGVPRVLSLVRLHAPNKVEAGVGQVLPPPVGGSVKVHARIEVRPRAMRRARVCVGKPARRAGGAVSRRARAEACRVSAAGAELGGPSATRPTARGIPQHKTTHTHTHAHTTHTNPNNNRFPLPAREGQCAKRTAAAPRTAPCGG
jgi:hypothetical protein